MSDQNVKSETQDLILSIARRRLTEYAELTESYRSRSPDFVVPNPEEQMREIENSDEWKRLMEIHQSQPAALNAHLSDDRRKLAAATLALRDIVYFAESHVNTDRDMGLSHPDDLREYIDNSFKVQRARQVLNKLMEDPLVTYTTASGTYDETFEIKFADELNSDLED